MKKVKNSFWIISEFNFINRIILFGNLLDNCIYSKSILSSEDLTEYGKVRKWIETTLGIHKSQTRSTISRFFY